MLAPAEPPKMVIQSRSPPKEPMLPCTQRRAATTSSKPWLPGACLSPVLGTEDGGGQHRQAPLPACSSVFEDLGCFELPPGWTSDPQPAPGSGLTLSHHCNLCGQGGLLGGWNLFTPWPHSPLRSWLHPSMQHPAQGAQVHCAIVALARLLPQEGVSGKHHSALLPSNSLPGSSPVC